MNKEVTAINLNIVIIVKAKKQVGIIVQIIDDIRTLFSDNEYYKILLLFYLPYLDYVDYPTLKRWDSFIKL